MSLHVLSYDMKRAMNILSLPGLLQCDAGRLKPEDSLLAGAVTPLRDLERDMTVNHLRRLKEQRARSEADHRTFCFGGLSHSRRKGRSQKDEAHRVTLACRPTRRGALIPLAGLPYLRGETEIVRIDDA